MLNEKQQPLPLGSIIRTKQEESSMMIVGHLPVTQVDKKEGYFDYGAVSLPIGLTTQNLFFFNKEDITEVLFVGYIDSSFQEFLIKYDELVESITYDKLSNTNQTESE